MRALALDLSKRSAGWAVWGPHDSTLASGTWVLGSEFTSKGKVFGNLHGNMSEIHALGEIDAVYYEKPLNLGASGPATNQDTLDLLIGLAMHAESWAEAMGCRIIRDVHQATWRRHFLGKMPRATKSAELKDYAMVRCRQLGFKPLKHDQAEAIGILDYACDALGMEPPWQSAKGMKALAPRDPFEDGLFDT